MTRTFEIVRGIVNQMDYSIHINSVDTLLNKYFVCKTLLLKGGSGVMDADGNEFLVSSFKNNEWVILVPVGHSNPFAGEFIYTNVTPYFLQGKWISANNEYLDMDSDTRQKTPLIWLVRGYEETFNAASNSVKMEVEPVIYFLDEAQSQDWTNDDHDTQAVNPMYNLAMLFVETVKKSLQFKELDGYTIKDEPRFGVSYSNQKAEKGNQKRILSDDLSGVGLRIPLKFFGNCKNC